MSLLKWFGVSSTVSVEDWANHNSNKATADELIAVGVIRKMKTDITCFKLISDERESRYTRDHYKSYHVIIESSKHKLNIKVECNAVKGKSKDRDGLNPFWYYPGRNVKKAYVNDVEISGAAGLQILLEFKRLNDVQKKAAEIAAKADLAMKLNEKKWNLAEELLGFERTENGALQPQVRICECGYGVETSTTVKALFKCGCKEKQRAGV